MEVLSSYIVHFYVQKSSVETDEDSFILLKKKSLLNKEWECIAYIQRFPSLICLLIILKVFPSFW